MGFLGFLFNFESRDIVVFVEKDEIKNIAIIGFNSTLPKKIDFYFLKNDLSFGEFIVTEDTKLIYSKLSLSNQKIIDFEYNTFWLDSNNYKLIYSLFDLIEFNESIISMNIIQILDLLF